MQHTSNKQVFTRLRQQRYRDRIRDAAMPTERQFGRALRGVVFDHMQKRGEPS
jgi:hypothetical protein